MPEPEQKSALDTRSAEAAQRSYPSEGPFSDPYGRTVLDNIHSGDRNKLDSKAWEYIDGHYSGASKVYESVNQGFTESLYKGPASHQTDVMAYLYSHPEVTKLAAEGKGTELFNHLKTEFGKSELKGLKASSIMRMASAVLEHRKGK